VIAVNVSQLLKLPPGTTREFEFSDPLSELSPEVELTAPVEGRARLLRTSRGILASTEYQTALRQECGRCLSPVVVQIQGLSDDEFQPKVDVGTGLVLPEQPESVELAIDERHVLDLTEVIRQDLLTRLPLRPLCERDCPGLCPGCGQDFREGSCSCGQEAQNTSPFADLAKLLQRNGSGEGSS